MAVPVGTLAITLKWVPWSTTLWIAAATGGGATFAQRRVHRAAGLLRELTIVLALYSLWGYAGSHADLHMGGAEARGAWIWEQRHWLPLPNELAVQRWVLPHTGIVRFLNVYYAIVHVPSLIAFLLWMFFRHRGAYPQARNVVAIVTGACLVVQLVPVAPPRLTPGLGFVDTAARFGPSVYPAVGQAGPNQFSAMPSVHVAWASVIAVTVVLVARSRWRWLALAHAAITVFAVVATGNHWWLDGIVAWVLLALAYAFEAAVRVAFGRVRQSRAALRYQY